MSEVLNLSALANVPQELAARKQWLVWRFEKKSGVEKLQKIPYWAHGEKRKGKQGDERDRGALTTLKGAIEAASERDMSGVGFAFLPDDGLIGIDIDGAINTETGEISDRCQKIIDSCNSYTEFSPSGKGVHIIVRGVTKTFKSNDIGLEVFCSAQYFTFTGHRWPNSPSDVNAIDEAVLRRLQKTVDVAKNVNKGGAQSPPRAKPRAAGVVAGSNDFQVVNDVAMSSLGVWVPALFPGAISHNGGYRVTSKMLGRDLQEDLSIMPGGIVDFGVADMGDAREGKRTPIDLVKEHLYLPTPKAALKWLAQRLGIDVSMQAVKPSRPAASRTDFDETFPPAATAKNISTPSGADAGILVDESWADSLIWRNKNNLMDCRENIIYFLRDHPEWRGVLALDDFSKQIVHRKDSPLGQKAGVIWDSNCEVELTLWLAEQREFPLLIRSLESVSNAIKFVASKNTFHPVREYFNSLVWDGKPRIEMFLHDYATAKDSDYHRLVGRYFFINLVRRVYEPGCVMRSVMVLEGAQDKGKSTLLKRLTEPWFSDTPLKIGSPDAYLQIQGVLLYEIAELEGFSKAEATAVKAFISSTEDNFRAPYDRRNAKHGRQGIFSATTNAHEYLKDWTGNTRFWPVLCGDTIRHADVSAVRDQLLAEAVALYKAGERTYPTEDQQRELFKPEADRRMASAPVRDQIQEWLELTYVGDEVTVKQIILDCMKVQIANLNQDKGLPTQVGLYLSSLGWKKRLNASTDTATGKRGNLWIRPADVDAPANSERIAEEIPF